jgi:nucleoside-diphosphate-sugar epimerase
LKTTEQVPSRWKFGIEAFLRIVADFVIVNVALISGYGLVLLTSRSPIPLVRLLAGFTTNSFVLSAISLAIFYGFGFYNKGRAYASRYKALIVLQASTLAFVVFGFAEYVFRWDNGMPRTALFVAWAVGTSGLLLARLWAYVWAYSEASNESVKSALNSLSALNGSRGIKSVLLIGGAGYVGSALLPKLLDKGYKVRLLDAFIFGHEAIADWENHSNLEIIEADFRHLEVVVGAMQGMDAVIHLGAIVGDPACALNEEFTVEVNVLATKMIAEVAKGQGIKRFIFASTCSVYGASDQYLDERSHLNPVSLYARSKIACEKVLLDLRSDDFAPVILRFGTIYGLSGRTRFDLVVNLLTAKAVVSDVITVFGSDQWRPFLHVDDAAKSVFFALGARPELIEPAIFNVGSDEQNYTLRQVGEIINRFVPRAQLILNDNDVDRRNYRVNFSRIRTHLGFTPSWTLEQGITQVMAAFEKGMIADYTDARYSNVKFISEELNSQNLIVHNGWVKRALEQPVAVVTGQSV